MSAVIQKMKRKYFTKSERQYQEVSLEEKTDITGETADLIDYLNDSKHYTEFALYLTNHYAIENLKFLESAVLLHNALVLCTNNPGEVVERRLQNRLSHIFDLKFAYLPLRRQYIKKINDGKLDQILLKIYNEFICLSGDHSINVSFGCRQQLLQFYHQHLFKNRDHQICTEINETKSICINVFNAAIVEIFALLNQRYSIHYDHYRRSSC
eukprot:43216_1